MYPHVIFRPPILCHIVWWIAVVAAPDPIEFTSDWWDHTTLHDEEPLPSARDLLTAFAFNPRLQLPQHEQGRPSLQSTIPLVLRAESRASPSSGPDLVPNAAFFEDVSLDSSLISRKPRYDPPKPSTTPRITTSSVLRAESPASPSSGPDLIPNAAFFEDVSLHSSLISRKPRYDPSKASATPESKSASSDPALIENAAFFHDASLDSRLIKKRTHDGQLKLATSNTHSILPYPRGPMSSAFSPDETNLDGSATQAPIAVDSSIKEILQTLPYDVNKRHQRPGQFTGAAPATLIFKKAGVESDAIGSKLNTATPHPENQLIPSQSEPVARETNDRIVILLVKEHLEKFRQRVNAREFVPRSQGRRIQFGGEPLAMLRQVQPFSGYVIRPLQRPDSVDCTQRAAVLVAFYTYLCESIHTLHEERLRNSNLPTYKYREQQQKLFNWLDNLIFTPPGGMPLMGTRNLVYPEWRKNDELEDSQLQLLKFLTQHKDTNQLGPSTVSKLLDFFISQQKSGFTQCHLAALEKI
ncbi:hypothetical protein PGTUg99_015903 [Puccinia graminis f. sp. tritici]|uniref:Uncharacterized protein n=1 Tax=Puccinia graminis f. sp. tritici TaxID=56615 RepID=A0A5B0QL05_PUCGR|nr:hypothetical protein PGTUg99_015903 [Puccinia graminis f. sp. tritici]